MHISPVSVAHEGLQLAASSSTLEDPMVLQGIHRDRLRVNGKARKQDLRGLERSGVRSEGRERGEVEGRQGKVEAWEGRLVGTQQEAGKQFDFRRFWLLRKFGHYYCLQVAIEEERSRI